MRAEVINGKVYEFHNSQRGCMGCDRPLVECDGCGNERFCMNCETCEICNHRTGQKCNCKKCFKRIVQAQVGAI